jgi:hypothetical protein
MIALQNDYLQTIDAAILFLQGKNPTIAHLIAGGNFLPQAGRFFPSNISLPKPCELAGTLRVSCYYSSQLPGL